ncbi:MAG TPA: bacterial proteasome activator family protein [Segeticoccus sp.]|uniref:bacterial proteasome activator family protein n=1 Tax=Segeticoccus sp. TaxID=2706531 RepID=UPI002D7ED814|nr:bacterial proteasome activator family protein [Segeticoccus sp.]HET8602150.1 bacterial proteasome activator family protein [Segeticoccus sp.]
MTDHGSEQTPGSRPAEQDDDQQRIVVVTEGGMGVAGGSDDKGDGPTNPAEQVEEPAKVMRIGSMIKQLLDEVRDAPLDEAGRTRLAEIHRRSIEELKKGLAPELIDELERIALPFSDAAPSDSELRIAQAQLVGWLEGLFHGIQTALFAQQMAAQQQLAGMRRALPPGHPAAQGPHPGMPGPAQGLPRQDSGPTGQYL